MRPVVLVILSIAFAGCEVGGVADLDVDADVDELVDADVDADAGDELPPTAARGITYELRAISHNLAGGALNNGDPAALALTFEQIEVFRPDVVMLQEICAAQVDAFRARYPSWSTRFAAMRTVVPTCGGRASGQLLASRWKMNSATTTPLGDPDGAKVFTLLCADLELPGLGVHATRACVTHLRAFQTEAAIAARGRQVGRIYKALHARIWSQKQAVVVGGDFNSRPWRPQLDRMYRLTRGGKLTGPGDFHEADQDDRRFFAQSAATCGAKACRSGEFTLSDRKYDYVFFSRNRARGDLSALAIPAPTSDHRLYRALAQLSF